MYKLTDGMKHQLELLSYKDAGLATFLRWQKEQHWTDIEMLYQALLFQTQALKNYQDGYNELLIKGPPPQYIITTQEHFDEIRLNELKSLQSVPSTEATNGNEGE